MMEHPETESAVPGEVRADLVSVENVVEVPAAEPSLGPSPIRYGPSGRRLYTWDELPPEARLRVEYEGKWVAWSADRTSILASAESLADLDREVQQASVSGAIYDWVDPPVLQVTRL